jgi:hypothetical protein
MTATIPILEASIFTINNLSKSGNTRACGIVMTSLGNLKVVVASSIHPNLSFLSNLVKGLHIEPFSFADSL